MSTLPCETVTVSSVKRMQDSQRNVYIDCFKTITGSPTAPPVSVNQHEINRLGGKWDRMKSFESNGGVLTKTGSGVELIVPKGAVSEAEIYGKVFTNMKPFYSLFKLNEKERFVSPVVEFVENNLIKFDLHLEVKIPCVHDSPSDKGFRVLCMSGSDQVESIPFAVPGTPDEDKPDVYYEVRRDAVHVFTKHFTTFCCVSCMADALRLQFLLFGSKTQNPAGPESQAKLRLYVCGGQYSIEDFQQSVVDCVNMCGLNLWDNKPIIVREESRCEKIYASITFRTPENNWKITTRHNGTCLFNNQPQEICIIEGLQCETVVGEWLVQNTVDSQALECVIDIRIEEENVPSIHPLGTFHVKKD